MPAERRWLLESIGYGSGLFLMSELLVSAPDSTKFALATVVGIGVGFVWERLSLGQVGAPLLAMAASFVHQFLMLNAGRGSPLGIVLAPLLIGCASSWLGLRRDMRPFD